MFEIEPIGIIHSPFRDGYDNVPVQGRFSPDTEGTVELLPRYREGLRDLDGFSHIILLYYFHKSDAVKMTARPYLDEKERGIFAIRSPHRPNHIGMTIVRLEGIEGTLLRIKGLDMIDGTPLLDIKPYSPVFDNFRDTRIGWMARYSEQEPDDPRVKSREEWLHE